MQGLLHRLPATTKQGWPWNEETPPGLYASADSWPRISIVSPSFNQAAFIEEAIRSVLLQNYPDLEFIIMDGGSTDGCVDTIKKYEPFLAYWRSVRDRGQSDAINLGLQRATGQIWAYLNTDDLYMPGTFHRVATEFRSPGCLWVTGHAEYIQANGEFSHSLVPIRYPQFSDALRRWERPRGFAIQVCNFLHRSLIDRYGYFDESLHYSMDYEYGLRVLADGIYPVILPAVLAKARLHAQSKTVSDGARGFLEEDIPIVRRYLNRVPSGERDQVERSLEEHHRTLLLSKLPTHRQAFLPACIKLVANHPGVLGSRRFWGLVRQRLTA